MTLRQRWQGMRTDSEWVRVGISVGVHLLLLAAITHVWMASKLSPGGTPEGTQRVVLYLPGRPSATEGTIKKTAPRAKPLRRKVLLPQYQAPELTAGVVAPVPTTKDGMEGNDALGIGSASIARVQGFPSSKPDLSGVTPGSAMDVVLDVDIDDTGRVSGATMRHGMGRNIDAVMLAAVERWVFYPATRNGRPVPSRQELHFHYAQDKSFQSCGWDCFELEMQ